jgi:hypothetical protein
MSQRDIALSLALARPDFIGTPCPLGLRMVFLTNKSSLEEREINCYPTLLFDRKKVLVFVLYHLLSDREKDGINFKMRFWG